MRSARGLGPVHVRLRVADQSRNHRGRDTADPLSSSWHNWIDFWTGKRVKEARASPPKLHSMNADLCQAGSIVAYGPRVESASAKVDPIELRLYAGANGDFSLYEDEGDNYDYEHGAHSIIPMHWDDKSETLTIGGRRGSFPGMLEHRTFHIVRVREGHGAGNALTAEPDVTVEYDGKEASVHVQPKM